MKGKKSKQQKEKQEMREKLLNHTRNDLSETSNWNINSTIFIEILR